MIHTILTRMREGETDLGAFYNNHMARVAIDDWVCFMDDDAMFSTAQWLEQLHEYIDLYPDAGLFTACTNRVYNHRQLVNNRIDYSHDMRHHRKIGKRLAEKYDMRVEELSKDYAISGLLMLIKKRVWKNCKFKSGFFGVDNKIHIDLLKQGYKVYLMKSVYVYHWYRGDGDRSHVHRMREIHG